MASDWPLVSLGEIVAIRSGFAFKSSDWRDVGIPVIKIANVKPGAIDLGDCSYVSREIAATARGFSLSSGDIVVAMTGYVGEVARATSKDLPAVVNQRVGKLEFKGNSRTDPDFLYAFLRLNSTKAMMESLAHGSAQPNLSAAHFHSIKLNLPPLDIQHGIGALAKSLDNRIDHNRALAANLEAIARALFKSWFVDFDPVRAKAAGEAPPGLAPDLAALFPNRFVDCELGEIPEGWANKAIGDVLAVLETGRRPKGGVKGIREGVPSVGAESINGIGQFDFSQTKYVPREFFDKLKTGKPQSFDTLLYKDGGKPGDFRPRIGMYGCGFPFDEYALNEHVFMLRADAARVGSFYLYFWMARDETMHILQNAGGKAAIPGINRQDVMTLPVQLPPMKLVGAFERIVAPMVERILTAQKESQRMAQLRDLLLPRLISGKLRVEDAEAALEAT